MSTQIQPYVDWLELPVELARPNYYELLGIKEFESDERKIKGGYYRRVARVSIYQSGPTAETCMLVLTELAEARDCLIDPNSRAEYDDRLKRKVGRKPDLPKRPGRMVSQPPNIVMATEGDNRKSVAPKQIVDKLSDASEELSLVEDGKSAGTDSNRATPQKPITRPVAGNASTAAALAMRGIDLESTYQNASSEKVNSELLALGVAPSPMDNALGDLTGIPAGLYLGVAPVPTDNALGDLASLPTSEMLHQQTSRTQHAQMGKIVTTSAGSARQKVSSYRPISSGKAKNQSQSSLQLWFAQYGILSVSVTAAVLVVGGFMFYFGRSTVSSETVQPTGAAKPTANAEPKLGADGVPQVEAFEVFRIP